MPANRVAAGLNCGTYFLTLTIQRWYYLFDRHNRWLILADSLGHCIAQKGLEVSGYVFMLNHIHLIVTSPDMAGFLRDFKKFTSKRFKENLQANEPSVLSLFVDDHERYQFWMDGNAPRKIEPYSFYLQKLKYIHENPVRKYVAQHAKLSLWSSATPLSPINLTFLIHRHKN